MKYAIISKAPFNSSCRINCLCIPIILAIVTPYAQAQATFQHKSLEDSVTDLGAYVGISKHLGDGFDPTSAMDSKDIVADADWIAAATDTIQTQLSYYAQLISSSDDFRKNSTLDINVDGHASLLVGDFQAAFRRRTSSEFISITNSTTVVAKAQAYHGARSLGATKRKLSTPAEELKSDGEAFGRQFGSYYVSDIHYGAMVTAVFNVVSSSESDRTVVANNISASVSGLFGGGNATAGWSEDAKRALSRTQITYNVSAYWNASNNPPAVMAGSNDGENSLKSFAAVAGKLIQYISSPANKVPIGFACKPVSNLGVALPTPSMMALRHRESRMLELFGAWRYIQNIVERYNKLIDQPFPEDRRTDKDIFIIAADICRTAIWNIENEASKSDSKTQEAGPPPSVAALLRVNLTASQREVFGSSAPILDLAEIDNIPKVRSALNRNPRSLRIQLESIEGTLGGAAETLAKRGLPWRLGFYVKVNGIRVATLENATTEPKQASPGEKVFYPEGGDVLVELPAGWNLLVVEPFFTADGRSPNLNSLTLSRSDIANKLDKLQKLPAAFWWGDSGDPGGDRHSVSGSWNIKLTAF